MSTLSALSRVVAGGLLAVSGELAFSRGAPAPVSATSFANRLPMRDERRSDVQSLRDAEPPQQVGAAFDDDRSMPLHAAKVASYVIAARLDALAHTIDGHATLSWVNASSRPATELYVHLYLNAFKNNRTVFLRSPFGAGRSGQGARTWGFIDVKSFVIRELGSGDLWPHGAHDDDDPNDETDIRVPLPKPIEPGEHITVDYAWSSQLPEVVERTGYVRDFYMVGQWFPKIARREPDGVWAHFPFNAQSEFYSDFGSYDVTLDVPANMIVGATGERVADDVVADRRRVRYHADDVHDFAWTAWARFRERDRTLDGVEVRLLYPPGNEANADATVLAVDHGLRQFGAAFGRYPYPTLTVVHPPVWAPAATGMEYPTLITTGFPWYTAFVSSLVERVTLHELAHQWFYGLVATDEHSWPFLDEGITTYAESSAMRTLFGGASGFRAPGIAIDGDTYLRGLAIDAGHDDVVARPAADFANFGELGALVYARTGTILETLARVYGRDSLRRAIGRYARRYRFEHPNPKHLVATLREVMGDEPADFLSSALFEGGTVDFVAKDLQSLPARDAAGVFDGPRGRETTAQHTHPDDWASRVLVYRHGTLRVPVDVELFFADGSKTRRHWDGQSRFQAFSARGRSPLVAAQVDPDQRVLLDDDLANNAVGKGARARVVERSLYAAELAFGAVGP